jgi:hypothetical protein
MAQNNVDAAKAVLAKYHGEGSPTHLMVQLELKEMIQQIGINDSDKGWRDYRELFNMHSARRRSCACLV